MAVLPVVADALRQGPFVGPNVLPVRMVVLGAPGRLRAMPAPAGPVRGRPTEVLASGMRLGGVHWVMRWR